MAREYAVEHALPWPAVYNLGMDHDIDDEAVLFSDIVGELAREGFVLHWQPLAEPGGRKVSKAEALIRWQHPQRGWVPPGSFIPLLERSALIVEFTDWVLRCAAVQVIQWRRTLHPQFQVSVNVPASYLARCCDQPEEMLARLASLELPAGAMVLEVTEGVLLDMTPEMQHTLTMVKGMGFLVALDDFGIGYSSFAMLEKLDLDFVKLDKSFVDDIEQRPSRRAICEAIISMVHRLGAKVVAEGVEQPGQLKWLSMMGVDYVQGFLLAKPMTAAALQDWAHARAGS
jgi:EAL domain-containing protein (putative c-di-GMP-specific phosphodiesterase class I)